MASLDQIENDFFAGNISKLSHAECPFCSEKGRLIFSVAKSDAVPDNPPGYRYKIGVSIYCTHCNAMLSHMDGRCPEWAERIEDWENFSKLVAMDRWA